MKKIILFIFSIIVLPLSAQENRKWELKGYVSLMGSAKKEKSDSMFFPDGVNKHKDALLHNRLNLFLYPTSDFTFSLQLRNRLIYDETFSDQPGIEKQFKNDMGWLQLSKNLYYHDDLLIHSAIDRFYMQYTKDKFEISLGRQRINWSQCFAWNPNDIFNASSYFDFDYTEKPGSDAFRIEYYASMATSAEAVLKIDSTGNITTAALYKTNLIGYDFQLLSGIMNEEEFVIGAGWSGNIKSVGFRGELTSLFPYKDTSVYGHSMNNLFLASLSFDYSFANSAQLMGEFLYSNNNITDLSASFQSIFSAPVTIRNMAFSKWSSLISAVYPVHPLINMSLSGMFFYKITGFYIGPNVDFSITDNLNLSLYWQYFKMYLSKEKLLGIDDIAINYLYFRLKYNF